MTAEERRDGIRAMIDSNAAAIAQSGVLERLEQDKDKAEGEATFLQAAMPYALSLSYLVNDLQKKLGDTENVKIYRDVVLNAVDGAYLWERLKPLVPEFQGITDDGIGAIVAEGMLESLRGWILSKWDEEASGKEEKAGIGVLKTDEVIQSLDVEEVRRQVSPVLLSTPAAVNLFNLFGVGSDLWENPKQVVEREKALDTHKKVNIEGDVTRPEILRVSIETRSALQVYELEYKYLEGTNAGLKKVYSFISSRLSSIFHDGAPVKNSIEFPLEELVNSGMYATLDTARKGFLAAGEALIRIGIKGWLRLSNKKRYEQVEVGTFFTLFRVKKGVCIVKINPDFAWGMFTAFYTPLPPYAYGLPINAFTLISLIFTIARQRWEKIGKAGALKFQIKMRHVQTRLNLPDENKTKNPRRDIRDVITKAIGDVEEVSNTKDFMINLYRANGEPMDKNPIEDDEAHSNFLDSISTFLAGYIEVELKGEYAESFKTIASSAEKRVRAAQRKREKALSEKQDNKQ